MATVTTILNSVASLLHRTTINDLNPSGLTPAGINIDLGMLALNAAAQRAQKAHDFKCGEANGFISIQATGGSLAAVFQVVGLSGTVYNVKRVSSVLLPLSGGEYQPVEFLTEDTFTARIRMQIGRQTFDATKTLAQLGVSTTNTTAYQNGTTIFLYPSPGNIVAQLNVQRFLPEYTAGSDSDFFTTAGQDYLKWAAVLELNKLLRVFVDKQESNVNEKAVTELRDEALAALIAYDSEIALGTSTPGEQRGPAQ